MHSDIILFTLNVMSAQKNTLVVFAMIKYYQCCVKRNRMISFCSQRYNIVNFEYRYQCRVSSIECSRRVHNDIILSTLSINVDVVSAQQNAFVIILSTLSINVSVVSAQQNACYVHNDIILFTLSISLSVVSAKQNVFVMFTTI